MKVSEKKYTWCFVGQIHDQGDRAKMIDSLKKCNGEYHLHIAEGWQSGDSLSTQEYKKILEQSVFAPCPRGNTSVDTFRLYEALEVGAIPIVEESSYWHNLFGDHPLITTSSEWRISQDLDAFSQDQERINNHRLKIQSWWKAYKSNLKNRINRVVQYRKIPINKSRSTVLTISTVLDDFSRRSFSRLDEYTKSNNVEHVHFEYPSSKKGSFHLLKWKCIHQQLQQGDVLYIGRDLLFVGEQLSFDFLYEQSKDVIVGSQNYSDWGIKLNSNITTSFVFIKKNERTLDLLNQFVFSIQKLKTDHKFYSYQEQYVDHQFELYLKQFQNYATINNDKFAVSEEIYGKNIDHYKSCPPAFINFERNVYTEELKKVYFDASSNT